jgi:hypothetical protein
MLFPGVAVQRQWLPRPVLQGLATQRQVLLEVHLVQHD